MGNKQNKNKNVQRDLNEKEIRMLMANTGLSLSEVQAWHKQFMTEFPNGCIDQKQFVQLYKQTYTHGNPDKFAKFAFLAFDDDHTGTISFDEFILSTGFVIHKGSTKEEELKRLELAFDIFDELETLYTAIAELKGKEDPKGSAKAKVERILKANDVDGTGSLSKAEFLNALNGGDVFSLFNS